MCIFNGNMIFSPLLAVEDNPRQLPTVIYTSLDTTPYKSMQVTNNAELVMCSYTVQYDLQFTLFS